VKYIAKPNTWYVSGTEVELVHDCGPAGLLMYGLAEAHPITCQCSHLAGNICHKRRMDEEICDPSEFEVIE